MDLARGADILYPVRLVDACCGEWMPIKLRDPISAITHLAGAAAALVGLFYLLNWSPQPVLIANTGVELRSYSTLALSVYGASLFLMFLASGVYHSVIAGPAVIQALRKVDHSAIYLLIAGSYTPFCVLAFRGNWQWGFLALIWGLAAIGILGKLIFIRAPRWFTAGVYVVMGWLSVFAMPEMLAVLPPGAVTWLAVGGVIYTLGAVVYVTKKLDFFPGRLGFHEIWHLFVLAGAGAHYLAVLKLLESTL
jgi:hemolysin III